MIGDKGHVCKLTVDGTDFCIQDPSPFLPGWQSLKFRGPALRYEVGVNIQNGFICWINGPFQAGAFNDISIFRFSLIFKLHDGEKVEADKGYQGEPEKVSLPGNFTDRCHKKRKI